jgi:hypothetical protein
MRPPISTASTAPLSVQTDLTEEEQTIAANPEVIVLITIAANILLFVCLYLAFHH